MGISIMQALYYASQYKGLWSLFNLAQSFQGLDTALAPVKSVRVYTLEGDLAGAFHGDEVNYIGVGSGFGVLQMPGMTGRSGALIYQNLKYGTVNSTKTFFSELGYAVGTEAHGMLTRGSGSGRDFSNITNDYLRALVTMRQGSSVASRMLGAKP